MIVTPAYTIHNCVNLGKGPSCTNLILPLKVLLVKANYFFKKSVFCNGH